MAQAIPDSRTGPSRRRGPSLRTLQVGNGPAYRVKRVAELTDGSVAAPAQYAPNLPRLVAVIDTKCFVRISADFALATNCINHGEPLLQIYSVHISQFPVAGISGSFSICSLILIEIVPESASLLFSVSPLFRLSTFPIALVDEPTCIPWIYSRGFVASSARTHFHIERILQLAATSSPQPDHPFRPHYLHYFSRVFDLLQAAVTRFFGDIHGCPAQPVSCLDVRQG